MNDGTPMSQETGEKILAQLERIAEAVEVLALKADQEFKPKSLTLLMRSKNRGGY